MATLRHTDCQDPDCRICLEDHLALGRELAQRTGNDKVDHLGKIHKWMSDSGMTPETEWGWATAETFAVSTIAAYVRWFKGEEAVE